MNAKQKRRLPSVMRKIAANKIARPRAAELLGVGVRQLNRLMLEQGVERAASERAAARFKERLAAYHRRENKKAAAQRVVLGMADVEEAAALAGCSPRTMYRWVEKARKQHEIEQKAKKNKKNAQKSIKNRRK